MQWFLGLKNNVPVGWSNDPVEGYIEVSQEVRDISEANSDHVWNGITLVAPVVQVPPPPTPEQIIANQQQLVDRIADACKDYIEHQVNAALQVEIYPQYLLPTPHAMVVATVQWVKSGYMLAEVRKSQVWAGIADNAAELCDFSILGEKPYTVYELYTAGIVRM